MGSQAGAFGFWDRECWERGAGFTWSTEKGKCLAAALPGENEWLLEMKGCFRGAPPSKKRDWSPGQPERQIELDG